MESAMTELPLETISSKYRISFSTPSKRGSARSAPDIMSTFQIDFPGTPSQFTAKAGSAIQGKGGTFDGDESKGRFHIKTAIGAVEGTYEVIGSQSGSQTPIAVTITKKPFIVSTNKIKEAISDFF